MYAQQNMVDEKQIQIFLFTTNGVRKSTNLIKRIFEKNCQRVKFNRMTITFF